MASIHEDLLHKIKQLEEELAACLELHEVARDAKQRLHQMQEECNAKTDRTCAKLTEQHDAQIKVLTSRMLKTEEQHLEKAKQLEAENTALRLELKKCVCQGGKANSSRQPEHDTLFSENAALKEEISELREKLEKLQSEYEMAVYSLTEAHSEHKTTLCELERVREALSAETKKKLEQLASLEKTLTAEGEKLQQEVSKAAGENCRLEEELKLQRSELAAAKVSLKSKEHAFEELTFERDRLVASLREAKLQESGISKSNTSFAEFVRLKRELAVLKEENSQLREKLKTKQTKTAYSTSRVKQ